MKISRAFLSDKKGVSALEFALLLPLLLTMLLGTVEVSNYVYAHQKLKNAANNLLYLINLQSNLSTAQLDTLAAIVPNVVEPITLGQDDYQIYVSSLQKDLIEEDDDEPYILWQYTFGPSTFGESRFDFQANRPVKENVVSEQDDVNGYDFQLGDQLIAVELRYDYTPITTAPFVQNIIDSVSGTMYYYATARPRKGSFQFAPDELNN